MSLIGIIDGLVRPNDADTPLRVNGVIEHATFPTSRVSGSSLLMAIPLGFVFFVEVRVLGAAAEPIREKKRD